MHLIVTAELMRVGSLANTGTLDGDGSQIS